MIEFIEGMVETYPNLEYLDDFPEVKVVLRVDVSRGAYNKVVVTSRCGANTCLGQSIVIGVSW